VSIKSRLRLLFQEMTHWSEEEVCIIGYYYDLYINYSTIMIIIILILLSQRALWLIINYVKKVSL